MRDPATVLLATAASLFVLYTLFGPALDPRSGSLAPDPGRLAVQVDLPEGTTLYQTADYVARVEERIAKVRAVGAARRNESSSTPMGQRSTSLRRRSGSRCHWRRGTTPQRSATIAMPSLLQSASTTAGANRLAGGRCSSSSDAAPGTCSTTHGNWRIGICQRLSRARHSSQPTRRCCGFVVRRRGLCERCGLRWTWSCRWPFQ